MRMGKHTQDVHKPELDVLVRVQQDRCHDVIVEQPRGHSIGFAVDGGKHPRKGHATPSTNPSQIIQFPNFNFPAQDLRLDLSRMQQLDLASEFGQPSLEFGALDLAPEFGWPSLSFSSNDVPVLDFENAVNASLLPPPDAIVATTTTDCASFDPLVFERCFVSAYCEVYQFEYEGIEDLVYGNTFGRRARVPFFRIFSDAPTQPSAQPPAATIGKVFDLMCADENPTQHERQIGTELLGCLYEVSDATDSDLFCGDLVLFRGRLHDWTTQKMSLRKYRQLDRMDVKGVPCKKRFLNKGFVNYRRGIPCRNSKIAIHQTLLWELLSTTLRITPTPLLTRLVSHLMQAFNRLTQLVDGDIVLDAIKQRLPQREIPRVVMSRQKLNKMSSTLDAWPSIRVFCGTKSEALDFLHNSVLFSICRPVARSADADVRVEKRSLSNFGGKFRFVYDTAQEKKKPGAGSVALVRVNTNKQQRENGRRGSLAAEQLVRYYKQRHNMRLLWLHELSRLILLQPLLGQADAVHVLIVMPIRNEVKYVRSLLPYHSAILTHRPVLWTGKSRKKGSHASLPGIEFGGTNDTHMLLRVGGQEHWFLKHLYVLETNSFKFKPMRLDGSKVFYV